MVIGTVSGWTTTWFISVANGFSINIFGWTFSEMNLVFAMGSALMLF